MKFISAGRETPAIFAIAVFDTVSCSSFLESPLPCRLAKTRIWWKDPSMSVDDGFWIRDEIVAGVQKDQTSPWPFTRYIRLNEGYAANPQNGFV